MNAAAAADFGPPQDDGEGTDLAVGADANPVVDEGMETDECRRMNVGLPINRGRLMYRHSSRPDSGFAAKKSSRHGSGRRNDSSQLGSRSSESAAGIPCNGPSFDGRDAGQTRGIAGSRLAMAVFAVSIEPSSAILLSRDVHEIKSSLSRVAAAEASSSRFLAGGIGTASPSVAGVFAAAGPFLAGAGEPPATCARRRCRTERKGIPALRS
jgi:hypothetical protein